MKIYQLKTHILVFLLMASFSQASHSQAVNPEKYGFKNHSLVTKDLGTVNYYVSTPKSSQKKPLLLYVDGSGPMPLFQLVEKGTASTVPFDYRKLSEYYHIVLISKPGVPFADSVKRDPEHGYPIYPEPAEYTRRLSLDWRVEAAQAVLKKVIKDYPVDQSKVAVMGISEGFQVGAKLAAKCKKITHCVLLVGNGLSQFYDFIIQNRTDAACGIIAEEEAQKNIDSLKLIFEDIYKNAAATDREWFGHTYLRWSSFCKNQPVEDIISLNIPVYLVAASKDRNTSVLSYDYIQIEALRKEKKNITFKVYPYDHSFSEWKKDAEGKSVFVSNHMNEVIDESLRWLGR
ncbi:MAG: hypothetical protein KA251_06365 [Saprospiraceae bacterium]|nr:hypothetical protein [Candidatus Vicinibacter affinis]MBP6174036.1 hypothetical protein [Saprospiraceae bacterium]MBK7696464.1 hypothetical protein [Candidatus Vicinibacter affinis]MBK7800550.1 hypothetical protein [Candidatus Vicinibacter affinis]MBK8641878.1 hypothetical protein [Candidatus Vicinibacter affinis]